MWITHQEAIAEVQTRDAGFVDQRSDSVYGNSEGLREMVGGKCSRTKVLTGWWRGKE